MRESGGFDMNQEAKTFFEELRKLACRTDKIYIYGAGLFGRNIYNMICQKGMKIDGFIVTHKTGEKEINNIPVVEAKGILKKDIGIVIGVNRRNEIAVREYLEKNNFSMDRVINGNGLMDDNGNREGYDDNPVIEITTKIGCKVNCKYCPQSLLLKKYFETNKYRTDTMDFELFKSCIQKLPKDTLIRFCGMSEPFLNPACIKMIQFACDLGRKVDLFTTLVGLELKDVKTLISLPIEWVNIHVADKKGYAAIPITEEYFEILSKLVDAKREDGTSFINVISAQDEPDESVLQICRDKYVIYSTLTDRAGNLDDKNLISKSVTEGKIVCSLCGQKLNHNILLPDGTLLLCCMDYGMKHQLGNLITMTYEEIMNGDKLFRIKGSMSNGNVDILCRNCSYANRIED